jgi:nucleotide-binding universal stress UspA family protein
VLICGRPAERLLSEAKDADLLVIGQRGLGGIQVGSVGHRIALHATVPVVVVPAPQAHFDGTFGSVGLVAHEGRVMP